MNEDFGQSLAQFKEVKTTLRQENNDHAQLAGVLMKELDEMWKCLKGMKTEGCINQGKLESSIASIHNLIRYRETLTDGRMTEMTSLMKERVKLTIA